MNLRPPTAAGNFYETDPNMLRKQLDFYFRNAVIKSKKFNALARLVPHSPYAYSGQIAAHSYVNLNRSNFVILGSNHSSVGANFALMKNTLWKTPIGEMLVDDNLANKMLAESKLIEFDAMPHEDDFSIEVQLPFLIHRFGSIKMVPILINNQVPDSNLLNSCKVVGTSIGKLIKKEKNWKLIGSSDLSQNMMNSPEKIDKQLLKYIIKLDAKGLFDMIVKTNAKVCGYGTIATTIYAAKELGAKKAEVLKYGTNEEMGEDRTITGYASVIFY